MEPQTFDMPEETDIAWCPGCGNFGILKIIKKALAELETPMENLALVSGIGQAAKIPHYFNCNFFNGLHGRALPPATAISAANPSLTVIAESGDGDMYGEGGNHFMHCIRRNPNITNIVHNNMVYGLTKGQASPTSEKGFKTPVQVAGVILEPFNPLAVAIGLNAGFVARAFSGHVNQTKEIFKKAIQYKGYALVDVFQPCVTFNKQNTYKWFMDNTYYLEDDHDPSDRDAAFKRACENEKLPLGVFYVNNDKEPFETRLDAHQEEQTPLFKRQRDMTGIEKILQQARTK